MNASCDVLVRTSLAQSTFDSLRPPIEISSARSREVASVATSTFASTEPAFLCRHFESEKTRLNRSRDIFWAAPVSGCTARCPTSRLKRGSACSNMVGGETYASYVLRWSALHSCAETVLCSPRIYLKIRCPMKTDPKRKQPTSTSRAELPPKHPRWVRSVALPFPRSHCPHSLQRDETMPTRPVPASLAEPARKSASSTRYRRAPETKLVRLRCS